MLLLAALLAHAAEPVVLVLPEGEPAAPWVTAAALGGLALGGARVGPGVEVRVEAGDWRLDVYDGHGHTKSVAVARPRTAGEREDLVWLAVSLLEGLPRPPGNADGSSRVTTALPNPSPGPVAAAPPAPGAPAPARASTVPSSGRRRPGADATTGVEEPRGAAPRTQGRVDGPLSPAPLPPGPLPPGPLPPAPLPPAAPETGAVGGAEPGPPAADLPERPALASTWLAAPVVGPTALDPAGELPRVVATGLTAGPEDVDGDRSPDPGGPELVAAEPTVAAPPSPSVAGVDAAAPRRKAWVSAGPVAAWRAATVVAPGVGVSAGLEVWGPLGVGVSARWLAARPVEGGVDGASMTSLDVRGGAWWSPDGPPIAPILGATAGVSRRAYDQDGERLAAFLVTTVGADVGGRVALSERLALACVLGAAADLNLTRLEWPDGTVDRLSPIEVDGALVLRARLP